MNIVELIEDRPLQGEPELVIFGYYGPVDGRRVEDPPEIRQAIKNAGSRDMTWTDARQALISLGDMPAAMIRVDTASHTLLVGNDGNDWHIIEKKHRLGRR